MGLKGGTGSVGDLVKGTRKGVLITSLWYIRNVDPRTMLYTGLLCLSAGRVIECAAVLAAVLPARWISRRIALT